MEVSKFATNKCGFHLRKPLGFQLSFAWDSADGHESSYIGPRILGQQNISKFTSYSTWLPSGNLLHSYWKGPVEMTCVFPLKMLIFHSFLCLDQRLYLLVGLEHSVSHEKPTESFFRSIKCFFLHPWTWGPSEEIRSFTASQLPRRSTTANKGLALEQSPRKGVSIFGVW